MFDVNLNKIELDTLYRLLDSDEPGACDAVIEMVEKSSRNTVQPGKQLGRAVLTDAIVDSIVYELKR